MSHGRVLIVEDELLFATDLQSSLEELGYEIVDTASDGKEAIHKAQTLLPDLILMDIKLNGKMSGIETSQIIKNTLDIPVIYLTAHSDIHTIEQAKLTEPFGFLLKPYRIDEVNSMIKTALHKHQIENRLRESEKRFRDMTDLLPQPVFELDLEGIVTFANKSFLNYFSLSKEDFKKGITFFDLFRPSDLPDVKKKMAAIYAGDACINCEIQTIGNNQQTRYSIFYANRIQNKGKTIGLRGTITDISDRKEIEHDIITQKLFFESLFENSPEAIASTDREGEIVKVNSQFETMFGYRSKEVVGKNINDILAPGKYHAEAVKFTEQVLHEKNKISLETKRRAKSGKYIDTIIVGSPVKIGDEVDFTIGIYIDITERKKTEVELKQIHELYQKTIQNANGVPYRLNLETKEYEFVGNGLEEILGLSYDEFDYDYFRRIKEDVIVHDNCDYQTYKKKFIDGKLERYQVDFQIRTKEGQERWISDSALPVFSYDEENVVESIGVLQDITERKLIEKQLRIERNKVQNYLDVAGVIFLHLDTNLNVTLINKKGCDILGFTQDEIIGKNWIDNFLPANIREQAWNFYNDFLSKQIDMFASTFKRSAYFDSKVVTKGKEPKNILWNNILLRDADKTITGVLCSGIDITEKIKAQEGIKKLNAQLKRKNHDLERIIYVTSHDLRSPLVNIEGFGEELHFSVQKILKEIKEAKNIHECRESIQKIITENIPESLQYINNSVVKIESLLSALLQLSRLGRQELDIELLDMNELFENILSTFEYKIKRHDIDLKIGNLPPCLADRKQINQLFSNLIANSLKFLHPERKGKLEIRGRGTEFKSYYYIKDNGIGIKPEHQEKIFEIFKRVHDQQDIDGEGLGLSIVRRILEKNNGDIKVESVYGQWAKFTVMLPRVLKEDNEAI